MVKQLTFPAMISTKIFVQSEQPLGSIDAHCDLDHAATNPLVFFSIQKEKENTSRQKWLRHTFTSALQSS